MHRISAEVQFTERTAAIIVRQIVGAICYLHDNHICHRNLTSENIMFANTESLDSGRNVAKVIGYHQACRFSEGAKMTEMCGWEAGELPHWVAPEVFTGQYDQAVDLWGCGMIMYHVLCGHMPWTKEETSDAEKLANIKAGSYPLEEDVWKCVSEDANVLLKELLTVDPSQRPVAHKAVEHEWLKNAAPKAKESPLKLKKTTKLLKSFRSKGKLQKAALTAIAKDMKDDQIRAMRDIFTKLDADCSGTLTVEELS